MQLSVACNLIPEGVRMLTGRWTISHRRSWITVCVFCCNAHIKSHSNCLACTFQCSINCPSVICLPSMLFICYGETPLVNCGPRSYFLYWSNTHKQSCLLSAITFCVITFHSIRLILCASKTGEIDNLTESLGQSILVVLCAGSTLFLTPVVRPANSQTATPSEATPFSYWSTKPWFLTEGKLAVVLIIPSSWGSQRIAITRASSIY